LNGSLFIVVLVVVRVIVAWNPSHNCHDINGYYWYARWNSGGIFWQLPAVKAQEYRHHTAQHDDVTRITFGV